MASKFNVTPLGQRVKALFTQFPKLSSREIHLKSKTDQLATFITMIQQLWFTTMFLLRLIKRLPITELEIGTMATKLLSALSYSVWWNKPQDLNRAAVLKLDGKAFALVSDFRKAYFEGLPPTEKAIFLLLRDVPMNRIGTIGKSRDYPVLRLDFKDAAPVTETWLKRKDVGMNQWFYYSD